MSTWAAWLMGLVGPAVRRGLASIGIGVISYAGVSAALEAVWTAMQGSLSGLIPDVAALLARAGFFVALSVMAGGIVAGMAFTAFKRLGVVSGT